MQTQAPKKNVLRRPMASVNEPTSNVKAVSEKRPCRDETERFFCHCNQSPRTARKFDGGIGEPISCNHQKFYSEYQPQLALSIAENGEFGEKAAETVTSFGSSAGNGSPVGLVVTGIIFLKLIRESDGTIKR